jgi:hypothetical protein
MAIKRFHLAIQVYGNAMPWAMPLIQDFGRSQLQAYTAVM